MSFTKITFAIFFIIAAAMACLFFSIPRLIEQPQNMLIIICAAAGIVLWGLLSLVVYGLVKSNAGAGLKPAPTPQPEKAPYNEKAVQVLALLQKKGRLIDFLQEDITAYEDSQIGAAVRNIHKGCREAITEYVTIEPVMTDPEGSEVNIEEGFDPSVIRLTGNVAGSPPFKGTLRHNGWRVAKTGLPSLPENQDLSIIEPAEVEME
jgi:hypothetical protein